MKYLFRSTVLAIYGVAWMTFVFGLMLVYIFASARTEGIFPEYPALYPLSSRIVDWLPESNDRHDALDDTYTLLAALVTIVPPVIACQLLWRFRHRWLALLSERNRARVVRVYRALWKNNRGMQYLLRGTAWVIFVFSLTIAYFIAWSCMESVFPKYPALIPVADKLMDWMSWSDRTPRAVDGIYALLVSFITVTLLTVAVQLLWRFRHRWLPLLRRANRA